MSRWSSAATWNGDGLHREVFFFGPAGSELYGSLYCAERISQTVGVVVCPSWGYEADRTERLAHGLALAMARLGGAGLVFHYAGYRESQGELAAATMDSLAANAAAAAAEAARRRPEIDWMFGGLMLGASVAALAQAGATTVSRLLFVQPTLSPSAYFARLARSTKRIDVGSGRIEAVSFGYPLPGAMADAGASIDAEVIVALSRFDGDGAVVRHAKPAPDPVVPERFEDVIVPGSWQFAAKDYPELEQAVARWLESRHSGTSVGEKLA